MTKSPRSPGVLKILCAKFELKFALGFTKVVVIPENRVESGVLTQHTAASVEFKDDRRPAD